MKVLRLLLCLTVFFGLLNSFGFAPKASAATCSELRFYYSQELSKIQNGDYDYCYDSKIRSEINHLSNLWYDLTITNNVGTSDGNTAMQSQIRDVANQLRYIAIHNNDYSVIRVRTFIPFKELSSPYSYNGSLGTLRAIFDDRTYYDQDTLKIRTEQYIVVWQPTGDFSNFQMKVANFNGKSQGYFTPYGSQSSALLTGRHSNSGFNASKNFAIPSQINASVSAGNGLIPGSPKIDYYLTFNFSKDSFSFSGKTHGFPAYEIWATAKAKSGYTRLWESQPSSPYEIVKLADFVGWAGTDIWIPQKSYSLH
ncbi:hypothetical protein [Paenibacillus harenae]|uniref:hypothetical protein n=1 Tax=Paenibacillus harenae TaxID=306543 RepID=UPI000412CAA2|nr:hypothetical protein [Paenibacillus harenae]